MKRMRRSSVALIAVGGAILALGTVLALTLPKDLWQQGWTGRGSRWGALSQGEQGEAAPDRSLKRDGFAFKGMRRRMPGIGIGLGLGPVICLVPAFLVGAGVGIVAGRRGKAGEAEKAEAPKGGD